MKKLADIEFGKARAELEAARYPELLDEGYIDYKNAYQKLVSGDMYLVLGSKGSGKSAIGEKLRIDAEKNNKTTVSIVHLQDFPFKSFSKIFSGDSEAESKYPRIVVMDTSSHDSG